jgi:hypothetical protein
MSHNLISEELIESVYVTLQNEYKEDHIKIFKGLFNFLKENDISNNEIRKTLQDFFLPRRDYIYMEYGLRYGQIGLIFEDLIDPPVEGSVGVTGSHGVTVGATGSVEAQVETPVVSQNDNSEELSEEENSNQLPSGQPMTFTPPMIGSTSHGLFTNPYLNATLNGALNNAAMVNALNALLAGPSQVQYSFHGINPESLYNGYQQEYQYQVYDEHDPTLGAATLNFGLNFFNIILGQGANIGPMTDVKNVVNKEDLDKLPVFSYTDEKIDKEKHKTCSICLEDFDDESKLRLLKCEHSFHTECIDKWLTDCNYKCPVCRDDSNEHHAEV